MSGAGPRPMVNPERSVSDSDDSPTPAGSDVVLVHGVTDDGKGLKVLRARSGEVETGAVRPLEEGKPILGEVVRLQPRQECPLVCDVVVDLPKQTASAEPAPAKQSKGPAQVASNAYRDNWDTIWARPKKAALPS
jgi:hypothetical protein